MQQRADTVTMVPWLKGCGFSIYSQFDEDGLIQAVFDRIEPVNRWCFEVGAGDGKELSNTMLLREKGWCSVLIERDNRLAEDCVSHQSDVVHVVKADVRGWTSGGRDLDMILLGCDAPDDLDFGVIDIDCQDYRVWRELSLYRPRVMLVEFCPHTDNEPPGPDAQAPSDQTGRSAILELGESKGYVPVAETHCNLLFVLESLL